MSLLRPLATALLFALAACATDPAADLTADADAAVAGGDAGVRASVPPILVTGVDPAIFLPTLVQGYHPTPQELATSGKSCASESDCASSGQVVFHCSTPYYGQAQCQGAFPPGDQIIPPIATTSCVYYTCPAGYECEAEAETHSVSCIEDQSHGGRPDGGKGGGGGGGRGGGGGYDDNGGA
jgi:hypothetical protein